MALMIRVVLMLLQLITMMMLMTKNYSHCDANNAVYHAARLCPGGLRAQRQRRRREEDYAMLSKSIKTTKKKVATVVMTMTSRR
jgi:hypothetical protein